MVMMNMSNRSKIYPQKLHSMRDRGEKIVALGVYDSPMAAWADEVGFDVFIIGNSGPMSLFGHKTSTTVKPEELLFMTQAVSRVTNYALIVATMPYMSYAASLEESVRTAAWMVSEGGADCVQCHGSLYNADFIEGIVGAGIPVLAHLGLQSVRKTMQGGYGLKGGRADEAKLIIDEAIAMTKAGVFAVLLENVPSELTEYLCDTLSIPIISLGSGSKADGVYLVSADLMGYSVFQAPSNAGQFTNVQIEIKKALKSYKSLARAGNYPTSEQTRNMDAKELANLKKLIETTEKSKKHKP